MKPVFRSAPACTFGRPLAGEENFYIRLAYSGIDTSEIKEGLGKFKAFIES